LGAPGWFNFSCGANYPHQALQGGYFVFVWRVGTRLDLIENFNVVIRVSYLREFGSKMDCFFRYLFSCTGSWSPYGIGLYFSEEESGVRVHRLHGHSRPRPWSCWSLLRQHFDPAVVFSIYCRPLAPVHDPGLVGCFFAVTSILPSFSRFMVESSSGYSD
jgi:hypothetical protein